MPIASWVTISFILAGIGLVLWLWIWRKSPKNWYAVLPVSWLLDVFAFAASFVIVSNLGRMDPKFYNTWGQVIFLHGLILMVGAGLILMIDGRVLVWTLFGKRRE
jgi:hypothetical protein